MDEIKHWRNFEIVSRLKDNPDVKLPERSTVGSAGYDFFAYEDIDIPISVNEDGSYSKPTLIKTGIKAYMLKSEFLMLCNRSSNPGKKGLILANGIGVVDSSYYNNFDNEGEIGFLFYNVGNATVHIKKHEKIGQGIFVNFFIIEGDNYDLGAERTGGFGSTGK